MGRRIGRRMRRMVEDGEEVVEEVEVEEEEVEEEEVEEEVDE